MNEPMETTIRHAKFLAKYPNKYGSQYIIRIALKELGVLFGQDGLHYAKSAVIMLMENPFETLKNGIYLAVGLLRNPPAGQDQVEQSIRFGVRRAWGNRNQELWASEIRVQRSADLSNWTTVRTYYKEDDSQMTDSNTANYANCVSFTATPGYYYQTVVFLYARSSSGNGNMRETTTFLDLR